MGCLLQSPQSFITILSYLLAQKHWLHLLNFDFKTGSVLMFQTIILVYERGNLVLYQLSSIVSSLKNPVLLEMRKEEEYLQSIFHTN